MDPFQTVPKDALELLLKLLPQGKREHWAGFCALLDACRLDKRFFRLICGDENSGLWKDLSARDYPRAKAIPGMSALDQYAFRSLFSGPGPENAFRIWSKRRGWERALNDVLENEGPVTTYRVALWADDRAAMDIAANPGPRPRILFQIGRSAFADYRRFLAHPTADNLDAALKRAVSTGKKDEAVLRDIVKADLPGYMTDERLVELGTEAVKNGNVEGLKLLFDLHPTHSLWTVASLRDLAAEGSEIEELLEAYIQLLLGPDEEDSSYEPSDSEDSGEE